MIRNHDIHHEFPNKEELIHKLKTENNHFKKLFDEYHDVNDEVHRIESGAETTVDDVLTDLRKRRLHLKDEIYKMLTDAQ